MTVEAVIMAILSAISASIGLYLKVIKPKREEHAKNQLREAVANGDANSVTDAVDRLSEKASSVTKQCDDEDIQRRLTKITGK